MNKINDLLNTPWDYSYESFLNYQQDVLNDRKNKGNTVSILIPSCQEGDSMDVRLGLLDGTIESLDPRFENYDGYSITYSGKDKIFKPILIKGYFKNIELNDIYEEKYFFKYGFFFFNFIANIKDSFTLLENDKPAMSQIVKRMKSSDGSFKNMSSEDFSLFLNIFKRSSVLNNGVLSPYFSQIKDIVISKCLDSRSMIPMIVFSQYYLNQNGSGGNAYVLDLID